MYNYALNAWDKKKLTTNVMNHFFLNFLYKWNVKLEQNNENKNRVQGLHTINKPAYTNLTTR